MKKYQQPDASITLREGLEEFRALVPDYIGDDQYSSEDSKRLFQGHDAVHVIAGLGIAIEEESLVDAFTYTSTDLRFLEALSYANMPEIKAIFKTLKIVDIVRGSLKAIPNAFRIWRASKDMPKKWSFYEWDKYLDVPLCDIRKEFNIQPSRYLYS